MDFKQPQIVLLEGDVRDVLLMIIKENKLSSSRASLVDIACHNVALTLERVHLTKT